MKYLQGPQQDDVEENDEAQVSSFSIYFLVSVSRDVSVPLYACY